MDEQVTDNCSLLYSYFQLSGCSARNSRRSKEDVCSRAYRQKNDKAARDAGGSVI